VCVLSYEPPTRTASPNPLHRPHCPLVSTSVSLRPIRRSRDTPLGKQTDRRQHTVGKCSAPLRMRIFRTPSMIQQPTIIYNDALIVQISIPDLGFFFSVVSSGLNQFSATSTCASTNTNTSAYSPTQGIQATRAET